MSLCWTFISFHFVNSFDWSLSKVQYKIALLTKALLNDLSIAISFRSRRGHLRSRGILGSGEIFSFSCPNSSGDISFLMVRWIGVSVSVRVKRCEMVVFNIPSVAYPNKHVPSSDWFRGHKVNLVLLKWTSRGLEVSQYLDFLKFGESFLEV